MMDLSDKNSSLTISDLGVHTAPVSKNGSKITPGPSAFQTPKRNIIGQAQSTGYNISDYKQKKNPPFRQSTLRTNSQVLDSEDVNWNKQTSSSNATPFQQQMSANTTPTMQYMDSKTDPNLNRQSRIQMGLNNSETVTPEEFKAASRELKFSHLESDKSI